LPLDVRDELRERLLALEAGERLREDLRGGDGAALGADRLREGLRLLGGERGELRRAFLRAALRSVLLGAALRALARGERARREKEEHRRTHSDHLDPGTSLF